MVTRHALRGTAGLVAFVLAALAHGPARADIAGCPVFPADNIWNTPVDTLPVDPRSNDYITSIGAATGLHPDFGAFIGPIGIPFITVTSAQPLVPINFTAFGAESDPGPYRTPLNAPIEGGAASGGDRHVLAVDTDNCILYELYRAFPQAASWDAESGARYDLRSNALRQDGFTSADAAGLAIFPGLVRLDEADAGVIRHAFRFTAQVTRRAHVWPARHDAGSTSSLSVPPMGQRFRLKAAVDISGFTPRIRAIFQAFKTYGLILADNGSDWFISGTQDAGWNDDELVPAFRMLHGSDFEAVNVSSLNCDPNSGLACPPPPPSTCVPTGGAGVRADYDGDGKADVGVYRGTTAEWWIRCSRDSSLLRVSWGAPSLRDEPVVGDFDGDGRADIAVYRQTTGQWFIRRSSDLTLAAFGWGVPGLRDMVAPGDYDGDNKTDLAVYRFVTGEWFIFRSSDSTVMYVPWGSPFGNDIPVPGDYDGDGRTDLAVYRGTTGQWFIRRSSDATLASFGWGVPGLLDVPVPGDFDGDGKTDLAVYRLATGEWFIFRSSDMTILYVAWGSPFLADTPVQADYDGDGKVDVAVYRTSNGQWFVRRSTDAGLTQIGWGAPGLGDVPVTNP